MFRGPSSLPSGRPAHPLLVAPALAVATLGVAGCATGFQFEPNIEKTEVFTEDFQPGEVLDLRSVNGRVEVRSWDRDEAEITAQKVGPNDSSIRDISVEIRRTDEGIRVRTRHPKRRAIWGRRYGSVNYAVRVPERADLKVATVNGSVEVSGIRGAVAAQTVNGAVSVTEQRGSVNARTVNGSIECELDGFGAGEDHSFRTDNGRVQLVLGSDANGRVDARAVNGSVVMELADSRNLDAPTRRHKRVQLGEDGGGECRVRTTNGAIHIANEG